jgi:hypothetical protein
MTVVLELLRSPLSDQRVRLSSLVLGDVWFWRPFDDARVVLLRNDEQNVESGTITNGTAYLLQNLRSREFLGIH